MTKAEELAAARKIEREAAYQLYQHANKCRRCDIVDVSTVLIHVKCKAGSAAQATKDAASVAAIRAWRELKISQRTPKEVTA